MIWLVLGCATPSTEKPPPTAGADTASAVGDDDTGEAPGLPPVEPEMTAEDVLATLDEAMALGLPTCPDFIRLFAEGLSMGDEACPGNRSAFEIFVPCTAASGAWMLGIGGYTDGSIRQPDGTVTRHGSLVADFLMFDPNGARMDAGLTCGLLAQRTPDNAVTVESDLTGSMTAAWRDDWFQEDVSGLMDVDIRIAPGGSREVVLTGGMSWSGFTVSFLPELFYSDTCGGARGAIALRDSRGYWSLVELGDDQGGCSTCGDVTFEGETIGEGCLNLSPLIERVVNNALPPELE